MRILSGSRANAAGVNLHRRRGSVSETTLPQRKEGRTKAMAIQTTRKERLMYQVSRESWERWETKFKEIWMAFPKRAIKTRTWLAARWTFWFQATMAVWASSKERSISVARRRRHRVKVATGLASEGPQLQNHHQSKGLKPFLKTIHQINSQVLLGYRLKEPAKSSPLFQRVSFN